MLTDTQMHGPEYVISFYVDSCRYNS